MIEVLTACILITFTLMILYVIGRLFKKKPKRMDEIKLEKIQVMHLGPFSGQSNSKKGKDCYFYDAVELPLLCRCIHYHLYPTGILVLLSEGSSAGS